MPSATPTMDRSGDATIAAASTKKIVVFLALTFALGAIFYAFIIASGSIVGYTWGLMWCPGVAALLTRFIFQRNIRGLGWSIKPYAIGEFGLGLALVALPVAYPFWRKRGALPAGIGAQ